MKLDNFCHVAPTISVRWRFYLPRQAAVGLRPYREFLKLWMAPLGSFRREKEIKPENVKWPRRHNLSETA